MRSNTDTPDGRGNDGFADHLRRDRQRMIELQFYDSGTITWEQMTRGVRAHLRNPQIAGGGGVQLFVLISDGGDWYNCYTFDGVNIGTTIVKVAKTQDMRCILSTATPAGGAWPGSPSIRIVRGITYTYTYNPIAGATADGVNVIEYTRTVAGSDASSATDYPTPCINVGDIIEAVPASFAGPATLVGVQWMIINSPEWAAKIP